MNAPDFKPSRRGKCVHFNGTQNKICDVGIEYASLAKDGYRAPCLVEYSKHEKIDGKYVKVWLPWVDKRPATPCEQFRLPTAEEIDADQAETDAAMNRMRVVMAKVATWRTWTKKNRVAKQEAIDCPTGCGGKLHLSQAAYNGHVWGKCTTEGCVSWME